MCSSISLIVLTTAVVAVVAGSPQANSDGSNNNNNNPNHQMFRKYLAAVDKFFDGPIAAHCAEESHTSVPQARTLYVQALRHRFSGGMSAIPQGHGRRHNFFIHYSPPAREQLCFLKCAAESIGYIRDHRFDQAYLDHTVATGFSTRECAEEMAELEILECEDMERASRACAHNNAMNYHKKITYISHLYGYYLDNESNKDNVAMNNAKVMMQRAPVREMSVNEIDEMEE